MFHRIKFGTVRRQESQFHGARNAKIAGYMPSGAIKEKNAEVISEFFCRMGKKYRHRFRIDPRHYEGAESAVAGADGAERIDIFPDNLVSGFRPDRQRRPTAAKVTDAAEPAFVLEQYPDPPASGNSDQLISDDLREVFLNVSWVSRSALTCLGRGPIFRHLCR